MNLEDQIQTLLASAEPLRALDDDDPQAARLAVIVDEINRLRALQAKEAQAAALRALAEDASPPKPEEPKRGPGRPKKGEQ